MKRKTSKKQTKRKQARRRALYRGNKLVTATGRKKLTKLLVTELGYDTRLARKVVSQLTH